MSIEVAGTVQSIRLLWDFVKANETRANYNELVAAVSEVNADLITAQADTIASQKNEMALTEQVRELKQKIMALENWERDAERYQLTNTRGMFAHHLRPGMENGEDPHHLCTHCYSDRKKSILQFFARMYGSISRTCPRCKQEQVFDSQEAQRLFPEILKRIQ